MHNEADLVGTGRRDAGGFIARNLGCLQRTGFSFGHFNFDGFTFGPFGFGEFTFGEFTFGDFGFDDLRFANLTCDDVHFNDFTFCGLGCFRSGLLRGHGLGSFDLAAVTAAGKPSVASTVSPASIDSSETASISLLTTTSDLTPPSIAGVCVSSEIGASVSCSLFHNQAASETPTINTTI
jgi:hypothetical protein